MKDNRKKIDKGLQKYPDSRVAYIMPDKLETPIKKIARGGKINLEEIWNLTKEEKEKIQSVMTAGVITLAGEDREQFISNLEGVMSETSRNEIWERNHWTIMTAVDYLTRTCGQVPTITKIASETFLSRLTIARHLKEYYSSQVYKDKEGGYKALKREAFDESLRSCILW